MIEVIRRWKKSDKEVGVIIKDTETGENFKGVARCHPQDEFNPQTGFEIALLRAKAQREANITKRRLDDLIMEAAKRSIVGPSVEQHIVSIAMKSGKVHVLQLPADADGTMRDIMEETGGKDGFIRLDAGPIINISAIESISDGNLMDKVVSRQDNERSQPRVDPESLQ